MEQQMIKPENIGWIKWVVGGCATVSMGAFGWVVKRLDGKVGVKTFEQFEKRFETEQKANRDAHKKTHDALGKLFDRMDGKG